jgi:hypothetical protein
VAAALAGPGEAAARLRAAVGAQIEGDARLSAVERLDVYAEMYFYRLRDCLAEDFRAVAAVVGPTRFHNLVTDYVLAHPSRHPSLRFAGRHLPAFLADHPLGHEWPFLADLAALEWAILDAFDAADAAPLGERTLETLPASAWAELRLHLMPSVRLLDFDWAVSDLWGRIDRGETAEPPPRAPTAVVVWRPELRVFHRPLAPAERDALRAVRAGERFGAVAERVAAAVGAGAAATTLAGFLRRWLADGLLTAPPA